jgi:hypothetical protein
MSQQFCTQCGTKLPDEGNFCPQCGAPREGVVVAPADSPSAQPYAPPPRSARPATKAKSGPTQPDGAPVVLYSLGGVALVALLLVVAYFGFLRPGGEESECGDAPCIVDLSGAGATVVPNIPFPDVARISVAEANALLQQDAAIFVDVRDRDSYTSMHIPGAVWIYLDDVGARHGELSRNAQILTYCA